MIKIYANTTCNEDSQMIHLYAEHLLNIQTLSIHATLPSDSNKETKASFSTDGDILTLTHEEESASIKLPINLSPNRPSSIKLTIPAVPSRELSFRVQLEAKEGITNGVLNNGVSHEPGNIVPWTAGALTPHTEILCQRCGTVLLESGKIQAWKDLPSEGWAEMMDFWHCHKPNEPHQDHEPSKKGYAANAQIALESGVGMVDVGDFLLSAADCNNIKASSKPTDTEVDASLFCNKCESAVGRVDPQTQGYKLRKLRLSVSCDMATPTVSHDAGKWLACQLIEAMDSQGVRKFVVRERYPNMKASLKVWIFTPDLSVSSSLKLTGKHTRVAKVLWRDNGAAEDLPERLNASTISEGELRLCNGELSVLRSELEDSGNMLPDGSREFQDWHIGLLERFTSDDIR